MAMRRGLFEYSFGYHVALPELSSFTECGVQLFENPMGGLREQMSISVKRNVDQDYHYPERAARSSSARRARVLKRCAVELSLKPRRAPAPSS